MVWSRKFLRTAALGAILALAFAGTALAADNTWKGGGSGTWDNAGNWTAGHIPAGGEVVVFNKDVTITGLGGADQTADVLKFADNVTLTVADGVNSLTVKKLTVKEPKTKT